MPNRNEEERKRILPDREWIKKSREDIPPSNRPRDVNLLEQLRRQRSSARNRGAGDDNNS